MLNREVYYKHIEEYLLLLAIRTEKAGKLNVLDLHLHSENFYRDFLNRLYGFNLENANVALQNVDSIDLIDRTNKIAIQVSATNTKQKIDHSLSGDTIQELKGYTFKFLSIAKNTKNLRNKTYTTPDGVAFDPSTDIYDADSLLKYIHNLETPQLKSLYKFIKQELGNEASMAKIESDLSLIVRLLSQVDYSQFESIRIDNDFEVEEKISFNQLTNSKTIIAEYNVYQSAVDRIYSSFAAEGASKGFFVQQKIRNIYLELRKTLSGDDLFKAIQLSVKKEVRNSANSEGLSAENIDICSDILIVDTFIRCKIFENPKGYKDVTA